VVDDAALDGRESGADVVAMDADSATSDGDSATRMMDPTLEPPRAIAPLSASRVTSHRPTLRWQNATRAEGAVVELSRSRDFATIERVERATGDRVRSSADLAPGVWFWRLRGAGAAADGTRPSAVWWFRVGARSAPTDTSWGSELDVNGDGYADLAVGAPEADSGRGRVDVFYGGPSGIASTPSATLRGAAPQDGFGSAVACAGDVNGDGYGDLIVGAPRAEVALQRYAGRATVYLGGASGLSATAQATIEGTATGDAVGTSVAGASDVNGDGFADVVIGVPSLDGNGATRTNSGAVRIHLGSPTGVTAASHRTIEGNAAFEEFGQVVIGAGDVDGDGFGDIAVGVPAASGSRGIVSIFNGSAMGISEMARGNIDGMLGVGSRFGAALGGSGDVNGDGYADLVVGAPGTQLTRGAATVFTGSTTGISATIAHRFDGGAEGDRFGSALASAGDINGDGIDDVVIGAPDASPAGRAAAGELRVFFGSTSGLGAMSQFDFAGANPGDALGYATSIIGDANNDTIVEFVATAYGAAPGGRAQAGSVVVFGGVRAAQPRMQRQLDGTAPSDRFGTSLSQ
jgi:hypothetical protein